MDHPVPLAATVFGLVILGAAASVAAEEEGAAAKRARLVSPHVAEMLTDVARRTPAATEPAPAADATGRPHGSASAADMPANGIVRLSPYLVREPRLPSREEVTPRHSLEQMAMQKYFGDETSLYRVMNMFSPVYLWRKIPVLGKNSRFMIGQFHGVGSGPASGEYTNEDRAMSLYEADKMRARWAELMGLLSPAERVRVFNPDAAPPPAPAPAPGK
jgi:hypothetical protein